jgi:hypothetical protein
MVPANFWDPCFEPCWDGDDCDEDRRRRTHSCYSKRLKADLLPGTFVLFLRNPAVASRSRKNDAQGCEIARIVEVIPADRTDMENSRQPIKVRVNIFKRIAEIEAVTLGILHPEFLDENHLRYLPEIVQLTEMLIISSDDIMNLAFVFTATVLKDSTCNLFFTCQGMSIAFVMRYRVQFHSQEPMLIAVPHGQCLPFPSSYVNSGYHDCYPKRIWNSIMCVKLEITKLLGRYSHLQGLYCKESCRLSNFTSETWGFLRWQFHDIFDDENCGMSTRIRRHRLTESGMVVKAARVSKTCTILRFETKVHLQHLCGVFGESATAGQRCRLPKISSPKNLWRNDIINVVCGSDTVEHGGFNARTVQDGVDLEFDGCNELFVTVRYRRFVYTGSNALVPGVDCDPLLHALICRKNPYCNDVIGMQENSSQEGDTADSAAVVDGSEFEDCDGCLYRVVLGSSTTTHLGSSQIRSMCFYPRKDNPLFGMEKLFDIGIVKELIEKRLNG